MDVSKLQKICGMLGSPYDGERAVAAERATLFLAKHDMTWHDLVGKAFGVKEPERPSPFRREGFRERYEYKGAKVRQWAWDKTDVMALLGRMDKYSDFYARMSEWEQGYIDDVSEQGYAKGGVTSKQWVILKRIARKLKVPPFVNGWQDVS